MRFRKLSVVKKLTEKHESGSIHLIQIKFPCKFWGVNGKSVKTYHRQRNKEIRHSNNPIKALFFIDTASLIFCPSCALSDLRDSWLTYTRLALMHCIGRKSSDISTSNPPSSALFSNIFVRKSSSWNDRIQSTKFTKQDINFRT